MTTTPEAQIVNLRLTWIDPDILSENLHPDLYNFIRSENKIPADKQRLDVVSSASSDPRHVMLFVKITLRHRECRQRSNKVLTGTFRISRMNSPDKTGALGRSYSHKMKLKSVACDILRFKGYFGGKKIKCNQN
jgi:hypothetical protein